VANITGRSKAADEKSAVDAAAKQSNITPARPKRRSESKTRTEAPCRAAYRICHFILPSGTIPHPAISTPQSPPWPEHQRSEVAFAATLKAPPLLTGLFLPTKFSTA
jgi:hypothetical protein